MIYRIVLVLAFLCSPACAERARDAYLQMAAFASFQAFNGGGGGGSLVIPAANNISANWQKAGVAGGIPTRSTQCGSTVSPSGKIPPTSGDDFTLITAAIASCTAGQVLVLATGTFNIALSQQPILVNKGISIRGSGSTTGTCDATTGTSCWGTVLQTYDGPQPTYNPTQQCGVTLASTSGCSNGVGMFLVSPNGLFGDGWGGATCNWPATAVNPTTNGCGTTLTADANQGDTTISVTSTANFSSGMWVLIDENPQFTTTANPIVGQASIQATADWLTQAATPATARIANPDGGNCTYSFCTNRVTEEMHKISSIGVGTLTFDSPLTIAFRSSGSHDARAYWPTTNSGTPTPLLEGAGIENMTIYRSTGGGVNFVLCANCWAVNIEVAYWVSGAVNMVGSPRTQVTSSYLHNCIDCQNNGNEYPIAMDSASTECLVDNNIITFGGKGMVGRAAAGCVVAYNYVDKISYEAEVIGPWFLDMGVNGSHYAGTHHILFEGNRGDNLDGDDTHGTASWHTFFRNQGVGVRTTFTEPSNGLTINDCAGTGYAPTSMNQPSGQTISSGTYVSATGVITLVMGAAHGVTVGLNVTIPLPLTGTGANLWQLAGTWVAQSGTTGSTLVLAGPTGKGTITITGGGSVIGNLPQTPGPLRAAGPMWGNYQYAYVANVLGFSGIQSCAVGTFPYNAISGGVIGNQGIWMSGWTGGEWGNHPDPNLDGVTSPTYVFRNGNYDYFNNAIVDNASGYAHTFPNSLYLPSSGASPPSWWPAGSTSYPFPWIDSTSGTPIKSNSLSGSGLPAKARYDAGTPFVQP